MIELVLRPARLRETRFVVDRRAAPLTFGWEAFRGRFVPTGNPRGLLLLRQLRGGMYVGFRRFGVEQRLFLLDAVGRSTSIASVLKRDPSFTRDLMEVYWVEKANWDTGLVETAA